MKNLLSFFSIHFSLYRLNWGITRGQIKFIFTILLSFSLGLSIYLYKNISSLENLGQKIVILLFIVGSILFINGIIGFIISAFEFSRDIKEKNLVNSLNPLCVISNMKKLKEENTFLDEDERKENYCFRNRICNLFNGGIGALGFSLLSLGIISLYYFYISFYRDLIQTGKENFLLQVNDILTITLLFFFSTIFLCYFFMSIISNVVNIYNYYTKYSPPKNEKGV